MPVAPEVFDQQDEGGGVVLLTFAPPEEQHAAVREAARLCPAASAVEHAQRP